jgi:hypothetical protein
MDTLLRIALTPDASAKATPLELLEDFADATPGWHFLEDESYHYAREKEARACVIRYQRAGEPRYVDLAFSSINSEDDDQLELVLIDAPGAEHQIDPEDRQRVGRSFLDAMRTYLDGRPGHATLHVESGE